MERLHLEYESNSIQLLLKSNGPEKQQEASELFPVTAYLPFRKTVSQQGSKGPNFSGCSVSCTPDDRCSGSDPMPLPDVMLLELRAEPGFAALGEALSQDVELLPGRRGLIVLTETRREWPTSNRGTKHHPWHRSPRMPPFGQCTKKSVQQRLSGKAAPLCEPRHARSGSNPIQLLDAFLDAILRKGECGAFAFRVHGVAATAECLATGLCRARRSLAPRGTREAPVYVVKCLLERVFDRSKL
ncbi:hypothetical protein AK812_SmicGene29885 [Symbiodinium microadriaticum]|uniref:Uncharacterized protein n=1 Tax=Symbiodinium microadriaticum TaxID=2951 RepID=A0A1Q9D0P7_SYMMI|nr:hypothetical protein AK812_SmicGene29885 [Symbiodinium microadriaticum]